jgi:site-specific DNA-methyltransferase (adenine-specific)
LYSFTNDIILDPFIGSGTTGVAALKSDRFYFGYDTDSEYIKLAEKRLEPLRTQMKLI